MAPKDIPVRVRVPEHQQGNFSAIGSLEMVTPNGELPLDAVAEVTLVPDLANINRRDGQRSQYRAGVSECRCPAQHGPGPVSAATGAIRL
jgi:Cu/Ag efflux pump CusA